eukprot:6434475-Prorocentrum_lima.AAC.1
MRFEVGEERHLRWHLRDPTSEALHIRNGVPQRLEIVRGKEGRHLRAEAHSQVNVLEGVLLDEGRGVGDGIHCFVGSAKRRARKSL